MCQYFPTGNFVEIEVTERKTNNFLKSILGFNDDHKHGYFKECDLENSQNIHRKTKRFAFCRDKTSSNDKTFPNK